MPLSNQLVNTFYQWLNVALKQNNISTRLNEHYKQPQHQIK
jgi:hypothetical protein